MQLWYLLSNSYVTVVSNIAGIFIDYTYSIVAKNICNCHSSVEEEKEKELQTPE